MISVTYTQYDSFSKSQYKIVKFYTAYFCELKDLKILKKKIHKGLVIINLCDGPEGIFAMPRNVSWPNKFALFCVMTQHTTREMSHDPTLCPPALHTGYL